MSEDTAHVRSPIPTRDADAPPLAGDTERGRFYRLTPDGPLVYPSITTVKAVKHSDNLTAWQIKMSAQRALEWVRWLGRVSAGEPDRASELLADLNGTVAGARWLSAVRAAAEEFSLARADRGTQVHLAIEQTLTGQPVTSDPEVGPFRAWQSFMIDFGVVPVEAEVTVVNHTHRYAGTGDLLADIETLDGPVRAIIDWKTRNSIFPDTSLQLAALAHAEFVLRPDGTQEPFAAPTVGIAVALREDGRYRAHRLPIDDGVFEAFVAARTLFDFHPTMSGPLRSAHALGELLAR